MRFASAKSICSLGWIFLGLLSVSQTSQALECIVIETTLDGSTFPCAASPGGLCADGTIGSGILKGTKLAVYTAAAPSAGLPGVESPLVLSYTADAVFTTKHGELHLSQLGVTDPLRQVFTFVIPILVVINVPARFMAKPLAAHQTYLALFAIVATALSLLGSRWVFKRALWSYRSASS